MSTEPTATERFINGIIPENPVYRQLLGMCPTLAVTNGMKPAITMALATAFVLICANIIVSLIRDFLKPHLRILVFTLTIATFVTIADKFLAQYNVGAQTRRTDNMLWHAEDRLEIHPVDAEDRGIVDGDTVSISSRAGETVLRAKITERVQPGVVYTTFHHPESGANVVTTDNADWATSCPEYKVTAVQIAPVGERSKWQQKFKDFDHRQKELSKGSI